jgi:hypothetical protein
VPEARREVVTGYEGLSDVAAIDAPDGSRLHVRGDALVLIYVGRAALPAGLDDADLVAAIGSTGERLRSRTGRRARMHVAAGEGIAWSEEAGEVGFIEIFPPTSFDAYTRDIYVDPGTFTKETAYLVTYVVGRTVRITRLWASVIS